MLDESPEIDPAIAVDVMSSRFCILGNTLYSSALSPASLLFEKLSLLKVSREVCPRRSGLYGLRSVSDAVSEFENAWRAKRSVEPPVVLRRGCCGRSGGLLGPHSLR